MPLVTPEELAEELALQLEPVPVHARPILLEAIALIMSQRVSEERHRCRELCERRAELWRNTKGGASALAEEARSRANEAAYLADLLTSDQYPVTIA